MHVSVYAGEAISGRFGDTRSGSRSTTLLQKSGESDFLPAVAEPGPQILMEPDVEG
jgi:hypothetical protein